MDKLLIISEFDIKAIFCYDIYYNKNCKRKLIKLKMSVTYKPKKKKRVRTHGFLKRMSSPGGKRVISNRRRKKRKKLSP